MSLNSARSTGTLPAQRGRYGALTCTVVTIAPAAVNSSPSCRVWLAMPPDGGGRGPIRAMRSPLKSGEIMSVPQAMHRPLRNWPHWPSNCARSQQISVL